MKVEAPFFVPFFTEKCPFFDEIKDDLISIIYDMHMKAPYEIQGSSPSGKHIKDKLTSSDHNFFKIEKEPIVRLRQWILEQLVGAYKHLKIRSDRIVITESWFHYTKKGGYHNYHTHPDCPLGGILYIEDGGSEVGNSWINPIHGYSHRISALWCRTVYESKFEPGQLILFPGFILHSGKPHEGEGKRILCAFNSTPVLHDEQVIRLSSLDGS